MGIIAWLQIVASPLIIGLGIGAFIYFPNPTVTRLSIAIIISVLGLIIGIVWANRIWKLKERCGLFLKLAQHQTWTI